MEREIDGNKKDRQKRDQVPGGDEVGYIKEPADYVRSPNGTTKRIKRMRAIPFDFRETGKKIREEWKESLQAVRCPIPKHIVSNTPK